MTQVDPSKCSEEKKDREPVGYKEVELSNGDIEMVPIYDDEDDWEDNTLKHIKITYFALKVILETRPTEAGNAIKPNR